MTSYHDMGEKVIIYDLGEAEETIIKPRGRKRKEA
jgi:hypothetical protein